MQYNSYLKGALSLMACALFLSSCGSKSDNPTPTPPNPSGKTSTYIVTATIQASGSASTTMLFTPTILSEGSLSGNTGGKQTDGGGEFIYLKDNTYLYSIAYHQGGKTSTNSYILRNGTLVERNKKFQGNRFTTHGTFSDFLITCSTGMGPKTKADASGYLPQYFLLSYLNAPAETQTNNDTKLEQFSAENFLGNGEYVTLCGLLEHEGKLYGSQPIWR